MDTIGIKKTCVFPSPEDDENNMEMSLIQALVLAILLSRCGKSRITVHDTIEKLQQRTGLMIENNRSPELEARWVEEHGPEVSAYGQCAVLAELISKVGVSFLEADSVIPELKKTGH